MTAAAITYTSTEKKRIRKSFAKRAAVLNVPFLLATQLDSFTAFLQAAVPPEKRKNEGLQAAFTSIFPIESHSKNARLEFVSFALGEPPFDVKECQQRGLTFASPLRAKVRLTIMDKEASKPTIKEVKEQEVYMGEIPLMTTTGSFVINGTERVIVSQLHRSPGVFFEHDRGKTHSSGKLLFSARIIPYRGSWLDFEFDPKDYLYFRVDRRRKMPVTILLKAIGLTPEQVLKEFFAFDTFHFSKKGIQFELVPERLRGETTKFDILDKHDKVIVPKDKRITVKYIRDMEAAGIKKIAVPDDFLLGRVLAHNVIDTETGEILGNANDEITETMLAKLKEAEASSIQTIYTNDLDQGAYISQTLRIDETADQFAARVAIYRMMRPGEPPTEEAVESLFNGLFYAEERYDLSAVGRMKFNRRVGRSELTGAVTLSNEDILAVIRILVELQERPRRDRRYRSPRQPARALGGRTRREPVPGGPGARGARGEGAPVAGRIGQPDAARPDQRQADFGSDQGVLRIKPAVAVHGPDQPAVGDHAQAPRLGAGTRRPHARARRLRGARRASDALRPRLPDRDAGRPEHRPDQFARPVCAHQPVRLHGNAVPQGRQRQGHRPDRFPVRDRRRQLRHRPGERGPGRRAS